MRRISFGALLGLSVVLLAAAVVYAAVGPIITITTPEGEEPRSTWIKEVQFDHDGHKEVAGCLDCHHMEEPGSDLTTYIPCRDCHIVTSTNDPDSFYMAWHSRKEYSCVGCHRQEGIVISCTEGCHPRGG